MKGKGGCSKDFICKQEIFFNWKRRLRLDNWEQDIEENLFYCIDIIWMSKCIFLDMARGTFTKCCQRSVKVILYLNRRIRETWKYKFNIPVLIIYHVSLNLITRRQRRLSRVWIKTSGSPLACLQDTDIQLLMCVFENVFLAGGEKYRLHALTIRSVQKKNRSYQRVSLRLLLNFWPHLSLLHRYIHTQLQCLIKSWM